jgi:hypothetical protein
MITLAVKILESLVINVWFSSNMMYIRLLDVREISVPLEWFPKLRDATEEQKKIGGSLVKVSGFIGKNWTRIFLLLPY